MFEASLVPEKTVVTARGDGAAVDASAAAGKRLLFTLRVTRMTKQESIDVSVWGSADGADFGAKPLLVFPQKFNTGEQPLLLDLSQHMGVRFLRPHWEVWRWGRGPDTPMFEFQLSAREVPADILEEAQAEAQQHGTDLDSRAEAASAAERPAPEAVAPPNPNYDAPAAGYPGADIERRPVRRGMFWLTVIGIPVAVVACVVLYLQFRQRPHPTKVISDQAGAAARESTESANRAERQPGQRPWINTETPWIKGDTGERAYHLTIGGPLNFPLRFTNIGETPARHLRAMMSVELVNHDGTPSLERIARGEYDTLLESEVLLPGKSSEVMVTRRRKTASGAESWVFTRSEAAALGEGKVSLAVYGIAQYEDASRIKHWNKFCMSFSKEGLYTAKGCAAYNDVDNN